MPSGWSETSARAEPLAPPLWALPAAAGLALLALGVALLLYIHARSAALEDREARWGERLSALSAPVPPGSPSPRRVVALGTSLYRCGLLEDGAMERLAARRCPRPVRFVGLVRDTGDFPRWTALAGRVREARPDVVLVDPHLLLYRPRPGPYHWRNFWLFFRAPLPGLRAGGPDPAGEEPWTPARASAAREGRRQMLVFGLRAEVVEALRALASDGAAVVVAPVPLTPEGERWRAPGEATETERVLGDLEREGLLKRLACPLRLSREEYADPAHLGPAGRARFSSWLLDELCGGAP